MADLEDLALKRDKKFLVRLILGVSAAFILGLWVAGRLTEPHLGMCAAKNFSTVTHH